MKKALCVLLTLLIAACCACSPRAETAPVPAQTEVPEVTEAAPQQEATEQTVDYSVYAGSRQAAVDYLSSRFQRPSYYTVYSDFSAYENRFTVKALIQSEGALVEDMQENCTDEPYSGGSCIRCQLHTPKSSWGGWLFTNGRLPQGETQPQLNFGEYEGCGMDLTGATALSFWVKGEKGGERLEFFLGGLGRNGESGKATEPYPDSCRKQSTGFITLSNEWQECVLPLSCDLSYIGCGFGFVASGTEYAEPITFYLDDIRILGDFPALLEAPYFAPSYETNAAENPDDIYVQNAAFTYDNALCALAFISEGRQQEAKAIVDSFVYAFQHDRYWAGQARNAYCAGDITAFPGWGRGARLPGWYDQADGQYYEDRYQVGTNVGNTCFAALALLQYYEKYGGEEYLNAAQGAAFFIMHDCQNGTPGFTAGFDGWPESGRPEDVYTFTYKSIEHNIDAYALFTELYRVDGLERYNESANSALEFIRSMYADGVFYTGTTADGVTPATDNIVLDAQVWSALALGEADFTPYLSALTRALSMKTAEGGYPFHEANTGGGYWLEGTAFTALALRQFGMDAEAAAALDAVMARQLPTGGLPAATVDKLTTGIDLFTGAPWYYGQNPHIAPVAWYIMALNNFNPYKF